MTSKNKSLSLAEFQKVFGTPKDKKILGGSFLIPEDQAKDKFVFSFTY